MSSFEEVKEYVRSVLVSSTNDLTLRQFEHTYEELAGERIPYRKLGYTHLEHLLYDFPDAVRIVHIPTRGFCLRAVTTKDDAHIGNLVHEQKKRPLPSARRPTAYANFGPYNNYNRQPTMFGQGRQPIGPWTPWSVQPPPPPRHAPVNYSGSESYQRPQPRQTKEIPRFVETNVIELLKANRSGIPLGDFPSNYYTKYQFSISWEEYGHRNLASLLSSFDSKIKIKNTGREMIVMLAQSELPQSTSSDDGLVPGFNCLSSPTKPTNQTPAAAVTSRPPPSAPSVEVPPSSKPQQPLRAAPPPVSSSSSLCSSSTRSSNSSTSGHISDRIKNDLVQILKMPEYSDGLWARELKDIFKRHTKRSLPLEEIGYFSIIELVMALPDVFGYKKCDSDYLLYKANCKHLKRDLTRSPGANNTIVKSRLDSNDLNMPALNVVPLEMQRRIYQIVSSNLSGMYISNFLEEYQKIFKENFKPEEFHFDSVEFVFENLNHILGLKYKGDKVIFAKANPVGKEILKDKELVATFDLEDYITDNNFSLDKEKIVKTCFEHYFSVYVMTALTPGNFWFQKIGPTLDQLEELMQDIDHFYYGPAGKTCILPVEKVREGFLCAAIFPEDKTYHRAVINEVLGENRVQVLYVDYGTLSVVERDCLCYLKKEFAILPIQAFPGKLAQILPERTSGWSLTASDFFFDMVYNKRLAAKIYDYQDGIYSLFLCDRTNINEEVYLHDVLVEKKFAIHELAQLNYKEFNNKPEGNNEHKMAVRFSASSESEDVNKKDSDRVNSSNGRNEKMNNLNKLETAKLITTITDWESDLKRLYKELENSVFMKPKTFALKASKPIHIKRIDLTENYSMNRIIVNEKEYITEEEICAFFEWNQNVLETMLSCNEIAVKKEYITMFMDADHWQKISSLPIPGNKLHYKSIISIYPLYKVPMILKRLYHPSRELRKAIKKAGNL